MPKVHKNVVILGAIAGGLVVAAGVGVGAYMYYKKHNESNPALCLAALTGMKVNDLPNLTSSAALDMEKRTATVTIVPFSVTFPTGGGSIATTAVPDCIMPKSNIALALTSDVLDQAQIAAKQGSAVVRFYPAAGGKSRITILYSPNNADGSANTSHWYSFAEGKFQLLAPIVLSWSF